MEKIKCVNYARVSSREQEETGYSLQSQGKLLNSYSENRELQIAKLFSVSESASGTKSRQVFKEMMEYIKKNAIKVIVVEKVDRLTRNLRDAVIINEWVNEDPERAVHFAKESWILTRDSKSHEKFIWNIRVSVSQFYTDNLSEEVKKGQKEKISQGHLPTKPPYGYKTIGEKGKKIHIIDEKNAVLMKKVFEFYATTNYSLKKLAITMFDLGMQSPHGKQYSVSRLADMLNDPFYYGKLRWNGTIYPGKQEPIISKDLFDQVQLTLKSKSTPKYSKHLYLFKGLIRCEECKGVVTWEKHRNIIYGHCNHYRNCSQKTWPKEYELDNQIAEYIGNLQINNKRIADRIKKALKESHKE